MTYQIRLPYDPKLYISRDQELRLASDWWQASKKRLLSVTAPPATGKTWFLTKVAEKLEDHEVTCIWLDCEKLLLSSENSLANSRRPNPALVNDWLRELVDEINARCPGQLEDFILSEKRDENVENLVTEVGKLCQSNQNICVFIDDGDQFNDQGWREFERWLLEPFAEIAQLRFVIAVRERRSIRVFPLRMSEERIKLENLPGDEQIERLIEHKFSNSSSLIMSLLGLLQERGYELTHPGINNFICLFAEDNPQINSPLNNANNIFSTVLEAVNPQSKDDVEFLTVLLHDLTKLGNEWDIEELVTSLQVSRPVAWNYLQVLEDNALITRPTLNRYEIVEGIRGFARAILQEENIFVSEDSTEREFTLPRNFHTKMDEKFSLEELEVLCFTLRIDPENALLGERKLNKIVALIKYCERHDSLPDLYAEVQRLRPKSDWS